MLPLRPIGSSQCDATECQVEETHAESALEAMRDSLGTPGPRSRHLQTHRARGPSRIGSRYFTISYNLCAVLDPSLYLLPWLEDNLEAWVSCSVLSPRAHGLRTGTDWCPRKQPGHSYQKKGGWAGGKKDKIARINEKMVIKTL